MIVKFSIAINVHVLIYIQFAIYPLLYQTFLIKFSGDNFLIMKITSSKFCQKIHPFTPPSKWTNFVLLKRGPSSLRRGCINVYSCPRILNFGDGLRRHTQCSCQQLRRVFVSTNHRLLPRKEVDENYIYVFVIYLIR